MVICTLAVRLLITCSSRHLHSNNVLFPSPTYILNTNPTQLARLSELSSTVIVVRQKSLRKQDTFRSRHNQCSINRGLVLTVLGAQD
ncbi:hypothetical protein BKA66DRAFT_49979 [Pyrenochaeta sp. MPI-SDFR-AT-0127]|nr:hypothetical protein BKA66DRAFT_49979 [Pyrenochaeta sp. MPI-SDFR-AT-0127]